jgi:hypothetical protein
MALNTRQRLLFAEAIIAWIQTQDDTWPITMLRASPTQIRNALRPFVQAIRTAALNKQVAVPAERLIEDADLATQITDADEVLADLDSAIVP